MYFKYKYPAILTVAFSVVYFIIFDSKLDINGDNASYYILGHAIESGNGYTNIHSINKSPSNHYPPGYPVIIAITIRILNSNIITIKIVNGILFLASILIIYRVLIMLEIKSELAFITCLFVILNKHLLLSSTIMMSEIPFLFFSICTIFFLLKSEEKNGFLTFYFLLMMVFAVAGLYIRTIGIALMGGIGLYYLIQKNWKKLLIFFTTGFLLYLPWFLRGQNLGGNSYIRSLAYKNIYRPELGFMDLQDWGLRILTNLKRYLGTEIPNGILPVIKTQPVSEITLLNIALGIIIITICGIGFRSIIKFRSFLIWYLLGFFSILLLWPQVWIGARFLQPIIPFLLIGVVTGVYVILSRTLKASLNFNYLSQIVIIVLIVIVMRPGILELKVRSENNYNNAFINYFRLAGWVKTNTGQSSIIACRKPELFYLYSNRPVTRYKYSLDDRELLKDLESKKVDFIVVDNLGYSSTGRYLVPAINKNPDKFQVILKLQNPDTYLLKLKSDQSFNIGE